MGDLSLSEARAQFAEVVDRARLEKQPVFITRHGRRVVGVVEATLLEALIEAAEELEDLRAAAEARREMEVSGSEPIPWEKVKSDLGLL